MVWSKTSHCLGDGIVHATSPSDLDDHLVFAQESQMTKKKIAVLGGGTGSLAAVWSLTELPNWEDRFDITVYQMGWRLGGKGASGRNPDYHQRIEEHGLHVWAGFYDNAFQVMKDCYKALDRQTGPVKTFEDAFKKHSNVIVAEHVGDQWYNWKINYPTNTDEPGNDKELPSIWAYVEMLLGALWEFLRESNLYEDLKGPTTQREKLWQLLTGGPERPDITPETPDKRGLPETLFDFSVGVLVETAHTFAGWIGRDATSHFKQDQLSVIRLLEQAFKTLERDFYEELDENPDARHLYYLMDMGLGIVRGLVMDGVVLRGWDSIDIWNWPDWMKRWGVSDYSLQSVMVRGIFDYIFGYPKGNVHFARAGAGTAIHGMMRLAFTYKGALFWEMQAGMGDIVFGPLYEVLKARGVKFEFFHKVENLGLNGDKDAIDSIDLTIQATVKDGKDYEPLIDVKGVPSWPSYPLYDQLVQGQTLKDDHVNLEYSWDAWPGVGTKTLQHGVDFDEVILGISIAAFPYVCSELVDASERFKRMVYGIKTVQTQAVQLWIDASAEDIKAPQPPVVTTGYVDPINTWADLSYLIEREDWDPADSPKFLAYFCGPMEDASLIPPFTDHDFPERERQRVIDLARDWFSLNIKPMWPGAVTRQNPSGLNLDLLRGTGTGEERFLQQYFRANFEPTERYVLSVPGSTQLRMKAHEAPFEHLFLAGDWTYTAIPAGCIECAVMSGMHCAEAISGDHIRIADRAYDSYKYAK